MNPDSGLFSKNCLNLKGYDYDINKFEMFVKKRILSIAIDIIGAENREVAEVSW